MATTTAPVPRPTTNPLSMRVNIRLCGSIPRKEMESLTLTKSAPIMSLPPSLSSDPCLASTNGSFYDCSTLHTTHPTKPQAESSQIEIMPRLEQQLQHAQDLSCAPHRRQAPSFEAPSWAVPAQGESRLEPVCEALGRQSPVDLTSRSVFRIGRSPTSDVQLLHGTSSRRHALLFHHSNGSCYIVDCGSAHGTYVNGVRVQSPPRGGVVVPHRVRRGSLVRFGGPGAPTFVLKSFSFDLDEMKEPPVTAYPSDSPSTPDFSAVVRHNTRFNALGKTAKDSVMLSSSTLSSKRSFDSIDTTETEPEVDSSCKRSRCSSPLLFASGEPPLHIVSPDALSQSSKRRRVTFSEEPAKAFYPILISPDISSDESDSDSV